MSLIITMNDTLHESAQNMTIEERSSINIINVFNVFTLNLSEVIKLLQA